MSQALPTTRKGTDFVCAVDLGGTNLRAAIVDRRGQVLTRARTPTDPSATPAETVAAIAAAVRDCQNQLKDPKLVHIDVVSIVVPGSVSAGTGEVVNAPNLPAVVGFKLSEALKTELQLPILIENDANAAALGEMWLGAARGCRTIVCLTLGTGVGSGIVLNGELWRGIDGTAGEIGHTSVNPFGGVSCKCGNVGCLEVYASATAIVRMTRAGLTRENQSTLRSIPTAELTAKKVAEAAAAGDSLARDVFREMGTHLGIAAATIVNTLNPEMIVIGGGVSEAFDLFADRAREEMTRRAFPTPAKRCRIVKAECGDDAGLLGAAKLAFNLGEC